MNTKLFANIWILNLLFENNNVQVARGLRLGNLRVDWYFEQCYNYYGYTLCFFLKQLISRTSMSYKRLAADETVEFLEELSEETQNENRESARYPRSLSAPILLGDRSRDSYVN